MPLVIRQNDKATEGALRSEADIQAAYAGGEVAGEYVERRFVAPLMSLLHRKQVGAVNRMLAERQPGRTLEIAPGPGRITREVRTSGELVCLEYNAGMIEEGRRNCPPSVTWVQGNAFELPFMEEFDAVYSFRFVRHFEDADRGRLYEQIRRVLKPGGVLVLDAVNERVSLPLRQARPEDYPVYDKLYAGVEELRRELAGHELVLERAEPVLRWFGVQSRVQDLVGPRWDWLCRRLIEGAECMPSANSLEWIVRCRRG